MIYCSYCHIQPEKLSACMCVWKFLLYFTSTFLDASLSPTHCRSGGSRKASVGGSVQLRQAGMNLLRRLCALTLTCRRRTVYLIPYNSIGRGPSFPIDLIDWYYLIRYKEPHLKNIYYVTTYAVFIFIGFHMDIPLKESGFTSLLTSEGKVLYF